MRDQAAAPTSSALADAIRPLTDADVAAVQALQAQVFGPGRFARTAYRVREGTPPVTDFCRGAFRDGELIASLRLTPVRIGGAGTHLLLGPLAVAPAFAGQGYGRALVADALAGAGSAGIGIVILVGDKPYYERFGFQSVPAGQITFPGPVNPARILAREITPGALASARGQVVAHLR